MSNAPPWTEDQRYLRLDTRWAYKHVSTEITWWPLNPKDASRLEVTSLADWICSNCAQSCWAWRTECFSCHQPRAIQASATNSEAVADATNKSGVPIKQQDGKQDKPLTT